MKAVWQGQREEAGLINQPGGDGLKDGQGETTVLTPIMCQAPSLKHHSC